MNIEKNIGHGDHGAGGLIRKAEEIADYFKAYPEERAVPAIADHINHFWTPKMREEFLAAAAEPGRVLPPLVAAARDKIKRRSVE